MAKYQWIKGDNLGTIETVKNSDSDWVNFESGRRISALMINEFMQELPDNTENKVDIRNLYEQHNSQQDISQNSGLKQVVGSGFSFTPGESDYESRVIMDESNQVFHREPVNINSSQKIKVEHDVQVKSEPVPKKEVNPILTLIKKSKKDEHLIKYEIKVNLPKKSTYNLIQESFDSDSFDKDMTKFIMESIDEGKIIKEVKKKIEEFINKFYKE